MKHFKTKLVVLTLVMIGLILSVGHAIGKPTAVLSAQEHGNNVVKMRTNYNRWRYTPSKCWRVRSSCNNSAWHICLSFSNPIVDITPESEAEKPEQPKPEVPQPEHPKPEPKPVEPETPEIETPEPEQTEPIGLSQEQSRMLELVNEERVKAGAKPLTFDVELANVANVKAKDMVDNNYFSHDSPTYGSPFNMMKNFGIRYSSAGENLAGYNSVDKAHVGLMNSDGHRRNILNPNFTHIGIGVHKSPKYGYVFVQMFIRK